MSIKVVFSILLPFVLLLFLTGCSNINQAVQAIEQPAIQNGETGKITVSDLRINPAYDPHLCDLMNLESGQQIVISVTASNAGPGPAERDLSLYIDWQEIETRHLNLEAGQSQDIDFNVTIDSWYEDGVYHVNVGELHANFGVG